MMYELTFLLPEAEDIKIIKELVISSKGTVKKEEAWGKRSLAYPIKKASSAYYFNWQIDIAKDNVNEFRKKLNFNEKLIRYLLLTI